MDNLIEMIEQLPSFKKSKRWNKIKNEVTFLNLFIRFYNICNQMFIYEGFPETCDFEYFEHALFWEGRAILVYDNEMGYLTLKAKENGGRNIYNKALRYTAFGFGGYAKQYELENGYYGKDCVICRNNKSMFPTANLLWEYLIDISDVKRAMMVNVNSTKTPTFLIGDKVTMKSLKNAFNQLSDNEAYIALDSELVNGFKVMDTTKQYVADKLVALKHDLLSELLGLLGITYVNTEKKERLITDEANSGKMFAEVCVDSMLETRKQFCEYVNKVFGLKTSVRLKYVPKEEEIEDGSEVHSTTE